jgi:hypothetical protein
MEAIMTESVYKTRRWWQVPVWVLMLVPVACTPVFLWFALYGWDPRGLRQPSEYEHDWVRNPVEEKFWPVDGERVKLGDPLVKIAGVSFLNKPYGGYRGVSRWVTQDGMVHEEIHVGNDAWSGDRPASTTGLPQLRSLLQKLPPSDPAAGPLVRSLVTFPDKGQWVVRVYRHDALPKEVEELAKTVGIWKD